MPTTYFMRLQIFYDSIAKNINAEEANKACLKAYVYRYALI